MELYRTYSNYLKTKYKEKVYKIPIAIPVTCPNRDGRLGSGGCIFCGSIGADYEINAPGMGITEQINRSINHIGKKYKAKKFIAYFLNFTATYTTLANFRSWAEEAAGHPDIVGLSVSTRPDCIHEKYLDILKDVQDKYGIDVTIELGLQSANPHTLIKIGRGHTVAEFIDASLRIGRYYFGLCAHMIADLPWDDRIDIEEMAKLVSVLPVTEIKIHSLYIVQDTILASMCEEGQFRLLPQQEYAERVILILSLIRPDIAVQRIVGRASDRTISIHEGRPWWEVKEYIETMMKKRNIVQGSACHYLNGAAVRQFTEEDK